MPFFDPRFSPICFKNTFNSETLPLQQLLINSLANVMQIYLRFHCEHSGGIGLNKILHGQLPRTQTSLS